MIIYMKDCRKSFACSRGIRKFFSDHNLDFSDFLKNGIDVETLHKTNDARAIKIIKEKELRDE